MAKLKLWISPGACSLVPHILIREAGLDYELVVIDIIKEGGFPEKYRNVNPKLRLPILELGDGNNNNDDNVIITEVPAISTYISQQATDKHLFGKSELEAVRVYEWFNWLSGTVHERGFGAVFQPKSWSDDENAFPSISAKAREWVEICFADIEEKLAGIHSVGDSFTAADVFLYVIYRWGHLFELNMKERYPKWTELVNNVVKREAVISTVEKEGIPLVDDDRAKLK